MLRGVPIAVRPPLPKAGTFKQATRCPRARDKQIGSDCDTRTSVSQRVGFGTRKLRIDENRDRGRVLEMVNPKK
jgi:hypothetical protein